MYEKHAICVKNGRSAHVIMEVLDLKPLAVTYYFLLVRQTSNYIFATPRIP